MNVLQGNVCSKSREDKISEGSFIIKSQYDLIQTIDINH